MALERILARFTLFLCRLLDVTPEHLEKLRRKKIPPPGPSERPDYFEA
jgi:hypothetical protein